MLTKIPLKNNDFNFSTSFFVEGVEFYAGFTWQEREQLFLMDIGRDEENYILSGIPLLTNVKLNKGVENLLPGTLFLHSKDDKIEKPNFLQIGETVSFYHYTPD